MFWGAVVVVAALALLGCAVLAVGLLMVCAEFDEEPALITRHRYR